MLDDQELVTPQWLIEQVPLRHKGLGASCDVYQARGQFGSIWIKYWGGQPDEIIVEFNESKISQWRFMTKGEFRHLLAGIRVMDNKPIKESQCKT